jgi:DtxR family Mn-dependent transcriptional regulator
MLDYANFIQTDGGRVKRQGHLTESLENYLKAILRLEISEGVARVKAISDLMNVSKPSATVAVESLRAAGYVRHETYGRVELTEAGKRLAKGVSRKHETILRFLCDVLKIDRRLAEKDACGMEHVVSPQTLEKITKFIEFMKIGPEGQITNCLTRFYEYCGNGGRPKCSQCDSGG